MMEMDGERVTIISDCSVCGRLTIGPFDPIHLRTLATLCNKMADELGLDASTSRVSEGKLISPDTVGELGDIRAGFDALPMKGEARDFTRLAAAARENTEKRRNLWD